MAKAKIEQCARNLNTNLNRISVLSVEDDEPSQKVLTEMLGYHALQVTVCVNGSEALLAVKQKPFDLIILDLGLPDMNGFELSSKIRGLQKTHGYLACPVLINSGHVSKEDDYKKYGVTACYVKPELLANLVKILAEHLPGWEPS